MLSVTKEEIGARIASDNLWWAAEGFAIPESAFRRRTYFEPFQKLALNFDVRRATILLGPRRVGKTVMLMQLIDQAIKSGVDPKRILYARIDAPIFAADRHAPPGWAELPLRLTCPCGMYEGKGVFHV